MTATLLPPHPRPRLVPPPTSAPSGQRASTPGQGSLEWTATFIGAAAILAGSSALSATIIGSGWVLPLVEVVVVITLIGVGGRMIRVPAWVTVLLQLAATAIALTSLFTSSGIGGVLPNKQTVIEAGQLLSGAWQQILSNVPPAPSSPELSFLIALSVGLAALIVDFLISEAKAPALVALPLLCLYSVPASIATEMLPWYTFAAPAILYTLLLAVAGHPGRRTGLRAGMGVAVNGAMIAPLAVVVALLVAGSVTMVGTTGRLPRTNATSGQIGLSPFTSLRGNLKSSAPINLLTVNGLPGPDYLRTVALTTWNEGKGWSVGDLRSDDTSVNGALAGSILNTGEATVTISSTAFRDRFLPLYQHTTAVTGLPVGWSYDSALGTVHRPDPANPGRYLLQVDTQKPSMEDLRQDTVTPGGPLTDVGPLPTSVRTLASRVTATATTAFDKANALRQWFVDPKNGFKYSLTVPDGDSGDALVDFLQNKQGFCEQYASAMAVMLRSLGIPARVAIGFTQGKLQADGSYQIDSHDAHAWVEVQFDTAGWVRFDPTPLVDGQGGQQGFGGADPSSTATSTPSATATGSVAAPTKKPDGGLGDVTATATATTQATASGAGTATGTHIRVLLSGLAALLVLLALVFTPSLMRQARRRRRMAAVAAGGPGSAAAAWSEIEDLATDHGVPLQMSESARTAANRLARRAHLSDRHRDLLRRAVIAAEQEWYAAGGLSGSSARGGDVGPAEVSAESGADRRGTGNVTGGESPGLDASVSSQSTVTITRPVGRGHGAPGTGPSTVQASPTELADAVRAIAAGLMRNEPNGLFDRWLPRSLRDSGR